jgi:hypothetical protein
VSMAYIGLDVFNPVSSTLVFPQPSSMSHMVNNFSFSGFTSYTSRILPGSLSTEVS